MPEMQIAEEKPKSVTISHDLLRCTLVISSRIIEHEMHTCIVGIEFFAYDLQARFTRTNRAAKEIKRQLKQKKKS